jgi:superfamily II RNA helicase
MPRGIAPKPGETIQPQGWVIDFVSNDVAVVKGNHRPIPLADLQFVKPRLWKLVNVKSTNENELDHARIKKQNVDENGIRNSVDDVLTNEDTDDLPLEDTHEELP